MKILSVGTFAKISNTSLHRHWALEKNAETVDAIDTSAKHTSLWYRIAYHLFLWGLPIKLPEGNRENARIKEQISKNKYDIVWIDKGVTIDASTLAFIKEKSPDTIIASYSPDNMALRHNQSQQYLECIPFYDFIFTNKSYILDEMKSLGAKRIYFVNNSYEAQFHYPHTLTQEEIFRLGGDVGFVGSWEEERCRSILYLANHGIKVKVFGDEKWKKYNNYSPNLTIITGGLFSEDYSKALQAFKISLCFLRKMNDDLQTTRTVEIPACGGFMLAERTTEHQNMFVEGKEADFFSSDEELLEKCKYYLSHDKERRDIAKAGNQRCKDFGYSNEETIRHLLDIIRSHQ
ncbi:MAG: glycosyltransferase [Bacteroidaceae bacterium]|nr:glycosyltransferase [Bacteroidaceae bacterium]